MRLVVTAAVLGVFLGWWLSPGRGYSVDIDNLPPCAFEDSSVSCLTLTERG